MLSEADTRAKLIDPKLRKSGWTEDKIRREVFLTPGKLLNEEGKREKGKKADYVLYYSSGFPIAVVEAKEESKSALNGIGQAKTYAKMLGVYFAFSTNGHEIEEFDFTTNKQRTINEFPTPEELYKRYLQYRFRSYDVKIDPLNFPYYTVGGKTPRYYQEAAIKSVIEAILHGKKRILLTMATGTGKTFVAFQIVWKLVKSGYFERILYIADRNFLRDQAYNEFAPFEDARAIIESDNTPRNRQIYFSTYQALYSGEGENKVYKQYPPDFFDLVIIDECHRSGYGTWKEILDYFGSAVHLGMTATPKQNQDNIDTYAYFGEPVYSYSMGQGIEDGFLAPFQIFRVFTNIDKEGLHLTEAIHQGAQVYIPEETDLKDVYTLEDFEREIILPDRTRRICEHLASLLDRFGPMQKTIVFCVNMEHAAQVAKELQNLFSHLGYDDYAVRIVAEEHDVKEIYEKFKDSESLTPVVATTVDLLTTGVDIPSVRNLVFLKPISSKVYFKQHVGRGCRIDEISKKYFFRIIDYVNATRLLDKWDYPSGVQPPIPEGPFDLLLSGYIVHAETHEPVQGARVVAQIGVNMQRYAKTDENGYFVLEKLPHSPITLHITKGKFRSRHMTLTPSEQMEPIIIELKPEKPKREKITVKGVEVYIAEETSIFISATGKTLTDAEYIEYSREGVTKRVATLGDLYKIWLDREKRQKFLEELAKESIIPELLAGILKAPDADAFDVLAHVAFGAPLLTRDERAKAFLDKKKLVIDALGDRAREVIIALLDKYRIGGVEQISRAEVFRLPPFDKLGYLRGVAEIFGGMEKLKQAINMLEHGLYESPGVNP